MNPAGQRASAAARLPAPALPVPPLAWIVAAGLVLALPMLLWGFAHRSGDGAQQEIWYANFVAQLAQGEAYPRWLPDMNGGLGSPVFFFYPPASFYITSVFQPFQGDGVYQWHALGLSAAAGLVGSGLAAYRWLRTRNEDEIAAVAAIVYMATPYHLAVDLHYRGALPEFWSFVAMPLVLYATIRTVQRKSRAIPLLAITYAFLLLTHPPTTLIFSWIPPAYALALAPRQARLAGLVRTTSGMALGIGLAAIYLVPALTTQNDVSMQVMSIGRFDYANAFFFPHFHAPVAADSLGHLLFWITVATAGIGLCTWPWRSDGREHVFWTAVAAIAIFMMFPVSAPIYEWLPLLPRIQFPWRFNTLLAVAVCALLPACLQWMPARLRASILTRPRSIWGIGVVAIAVLLTWTLQSYNPIARAPEAPSRERKALNIDASEYRPRWATQDIPTTLAALGVEAGRVPPVAVVEGSGRVTVLGHGTRRLVLEADTAGAVVEVRQFYYPGWQASLATGERLPVGHSVPAGLIRFAVPAGKQVVTLRLGETAPERIGRWVSLVSAALVCCLGLWPLRPSGGRYGGHGA